MANTDEIPYQPVWVTFDPVICGVILRREIEAKIDGKVWQVLMSRSNGDVRTLNVLKKKS